MNNKEFVFISNAEYTQRISNAYNAGYRHGRSEAITKMTNLVTLAYHPNKTTTPIAVNNKPAAKATKKTKVKVGKK